MASLYQPSNQPTMWDIAQRTLVNAAVLQVAGRLFGNVSQREALAISDQKMEASNQTAGQAMAISNIGSILGRTPELEKLMSVDPIKGKAVYDDMVSDIRAFEKGNYNWTDSTMKDAKGNFVERIGMNKSVSQSANTALDHLEAMGPRLVEKGRLTTEYDTLLDGLRAEGEKIKGLDFSRQGDLLKLVESLETNAMKRSEIGMPTERITNQLQRYGDFQEAAAMALEMDANKGELGLQMAVANADLANATVDFGDPKDWGKDLTSTIKKLETDLRSNKIIEAVQGHTDVTYKDAAEMVNIYFKSGRPVQAMFLMDKLLPDSTGMANAQKIATLQQALKNADYEMTNRQVTWVNKYLTNIKASRDEMKTQHVNLANQFVIRASGVRKDLINDFKTFFGKTSIGDIAQMNEEEIKNLILLDTGETKDPMDLNTKNLFASYVAEWSPIPKATTTERDVLGSRRNIYHSSLTGGGGDLLRIIAAGGKEGTEDDKIFVWVGEKDSVDPATGELTGKKEGIFESRTYDQIGQLTDKQILNTLASNNRKYGLRWILGMDLPADMSAEKRNEEANKRASELYYGDDAGLFQITERTSNYKMQALKGAEGKLVQSMAKHWYTQYKDYESLIGEKDRHDQQVQLIDGFDQLIVAGYNETAAIISPELKTILDTIKKASDVGDGNSSATDTRDGEIITKNADNIFDKDSEEKVDLILNQDKKVTPTVKSADEFYTQADQNIAKKKGFESAQEHADVLNVLSNIQKDNPEQVVDGKFDWVGSLVGGVIDSSQYNMAKRVLPTLPDVNTVLTDLEIEAVGDSTSITVPDSVDISSSTSYAQDAGSLEQTALNNLEVSGVSNLMDATNQQAPSFVPQEPRQRSDVEIGRDNREKFSQIAISMKKIKTLFNPKSFTNPQAQKNMSEEARQMREDLKQYILEEGIYDPKTGRIDKDFMRIFEGGSKQRVDRWGGVWAEDYDRKEVLDYIYGLFKGKKSVRFSKVG